MKNPLNYFDYMPEIYSKEDLSYFFGPHFNQKPVPNRNNLKEIFIRDNRVGSVMKIDPQFGHAVFITNPNDYIDLIRKEMSDNNLPPIARAIVQQHLDLLYSYQSNNELKKAQEELRSAFNEPY